MRILSLSVKRLVFASFLIAAFLFLSDWILRKMGYLSEPPFQVAYPQGYTTKRKNIEFSYAFRVNSLGLRYKELPLQKSNGEFRVLVLGDSFVEGVGVDEEDTFPAILESKLSESNKPVRFINAGLRGVGPMQYARIFYNVGLKYNPDAVLIVLYGNDVGDTPPLEKEFLDSGEGWLYPYRVNPDRKGVKKLLHRLWPRIYMTSVQAYKKIEDRRPKDIITIGTKEAITRGISKEKIDLWRKTLPATLVEAANRDEVSPYILLRDFLDPHFWVKSLDIEGPEAEKKWLGVERAISKIHELAVERGIKVGMVYVPVPYQYDRNYGAMTKKLGGIVKDEWLSRETEFEKRLGKWAAAHRSPFLNLTPYCRLANEKLQGKCHYPIDGHWTPKGNQVAAYAISVWLKYIDMIPWPKGAPVFEAASLFELDTHSLKKEKLAKSNSQ